VAHHRSARGRRGGAGHVTRRGFAVLAAALGLAPALLAGQSHPFDAGPATAHNRIDELVFQRLASLHTPPAALASDVVFVRRVYLDTIGSLPSAGDVTAFLADPSPNKRSALIDRLLARDEFADYWAMKWDDSLRVKSEFPINLWPNAVQAYHRWIRAALAAHLPYDQFARALLTESGSNFREGPVNFYRAVQGRDPQTIASAVALTFMGQRTAAWPKDRLANLAAFFSELGYKSTGEWKEEIVFFDPSKRTAGAPAFVLPDGSRPRVGPDDDPRAVFADWLVSPKNASFNAAIVNRVWFWLIGRGIVQEPDDLRPDNPPDNPELLAYLEHELVAAHYDLGALYRLILNSATYQLSSIAPDQHGDPAPNFGVSIVRPIDAEVLLDAICAITGTTAQYSSAIPEPYTFTPIDQRAIALADGSISSAFLDTFGRPHRDTGLLLERSTTPSAAARLYLLNSSDVQRRIQQGPRLIALIQSTPDPRELVNRIYLTILSRPPTDDEMRQAVAYAAKAGNRRNAATDLAWALINTVEFLYRH
jgi:hypothetical protein